MGLISDIQRIITAKYPDATFILSSKFNANLESFSVDSDKLPLIILDNEISKNNAIQKNNNIMKEHKIVCSFFALDYPDNTDVQTNALIEAMEVYSDWLAGQIFRLVEARIISGNQKYKITPMFHIFNTNLSGISLEMLVNYNSIIKM